MTAPKHPRTKTVRDAMDRYGVSRQRIYRLMQQRGVKGRKSGVVILLSEQEIRRLRPGKEGRPKGP